MMDSSSYEPDLLMRIVLEMPSLRGQLSNPNLSTVAVEIPPVDVNKLPDEFSLGRSADLFVFFFMGEERRREKKGWKEKSQA